MSKKDASRERILKAASRLVREKGAEQVSVNDVMSAAGLTHGGFYAHFKNKAELLQAALHVGAEENREIWFRQLEDATPAQALPALAARYLNGHHRDAPGSGCPFALLPLDASRQAATLGDQFTGEFIASLNRLCSALGDEGDPRIRQSSLAFLALCVGGMALSRAVNDEELSDDILRAARSAGLRAVAPVINQHRTEADEIRGDRHVR